jgi:hypothetical protein
LCPCVRARPWTIVSRAERVGDNDVRRSRLSRSSGVYCLNSRNDGLVSFERVGTHVGDQAAACGVGGCGQSACGRRRRQRDARCSCSVVVYLTRIHRCLLHIRPRAPLPLCPHSTPRRPAKSVVARRCPRRRVVCVVCVRACAVYDVVGELAAGDDVSIDRDDDDDDSSSSAC